MSDAKAHESVAWRTNLGLFLATVASVFFTGVVTDGAAAAAGQGGSFVQAILGPFAMPRALAHGAEFTGTLLTILVAHELGHYFAARIHKVDASLPYFIPMPLLSPFGTMGAIIRMRGVIPTRRALLDIGAAGPIAGLVFAIPLYAWGVAHSHVVTPSPGSVGLGESILIKVIHQLAGPTIPAGMDLELSPVAFGAWGGMFVTMINLFPVSQLDGGHVAYALFGSRQDRFAVLVHRAMLAFFFLIIGAHVARDVVSGVGLYHLGQHVANAIFWLVWFEILAILGALADRARRDDPKPGQVSISTRIIATVGLVVLASLAREHGSPLLLVAFFAGLGLLLAMEAKGGVLRKHDTLDHPPTSAAPLDKTRAAIAIATLVMFVLLFMPEPIMM